MTSEVYVQLDFARDMLAEHRYDLAFAAFCEIGSEFRYVRRSSRRLHPRPYIVTEADWDTDELGDFEPEVDQRRRQVKEWRAMPWLAWPEPLRTWDFDTVMRQLYAPDVVADLAGRNGHFTVTAINQTMGTITLEPVRPQVAVMHPDAYTRYRDHLHQRSAETYGMSAELLGVRVLPDPHCPPGRMYMIDAAPRRQHPLFEMLPKPARVEPEAFAMRDWAALGYGGISFDHETIAPSHGDLFAFRCDGPACRKRVSAALYAILSGAWQSAAWEPTPKQRRAPPAAARPPRRSTRAARAASRRADRPRPASSARSTAR